MIRYLQESDTDNGGSGITEKFSPSFTYGNRIPGEDFEGMYGVKPVRYQQMIEKDGADIGIGQKQ